MAEPDFAGFLPMTGLILSIVISVTLFLVHEYVILPPIARRLRKAKWNKGVIAFIQDDTGNVRLTISTKELPEGVIKTNRGWFLLPRPSTIDTEPEVTHRGPGRPKKLPEGTESVDVPIVERKKTELENIELNGKLLHVPLLQGLGKQVFFGSVSSAMLTNLWALSHADLLQARKLIPMNTQKTQLDALATGSRIEGMKMMGGDVMKWIVYVIIACIPIAIIGLVFWFLTQGRAPAPVAGLAALIGVIV